MFGIFYRHPLVECSGSTLPGYCYVPISVGGNHIPDLSLSFLPCHPNFRIMDSCNGLLLCLFRNSVQALYYVCNPVTKEWFVLPEYYRATFGIPKLAFNPQISLHFEVILVHQISSWPQHALLVIFSSDSGKWDEYKVLSPPIKWSGERSDVHLNGIWHMLADPHHVLSINLKGSTYRSISLPGYKLCRRTLRQHEGRLYYMGHDSYCLEVWMLDYNNNEWILEYVTSIQALLQGLSEPICQYLQWPFPFRLLYFHPDYGVLILARHCRIYSYHLASMVLQEICRVTCGMHYTGYWQDPPCWGFPFTPCLKPFRSGSISDPQ